MYDFAAKNRFSMPRRPQACRHMVSCCRECIVEAQRRGIMSCPVCRGGLHDLFTDTTLKTLVDELAVYCANRPPCNWTGPRSNLKEHLERSCAHNRCTHSARGCAWTGNHTDKAAHLANACNFSMTPCPNTADGCNTRAERRLLPEHLKECPIAMRRKAAEEAAKRKEERQRQVQAQLLAVTPVATVHLNVGGRVLLTTGAGDCSDSAVDVAAIRLNNEATWSSHMLRERGFSWLRASRMRSVKCSRFWAQASRRSATEVMRRSSSTAVRSFNFAAFPFTASLQ